MLVIDSDGTSRRFSPLHYVQKQYYEYFISINTFSTQQRHSEDEDIKLYCVEDIQPIKTIPTKNLSSRSSFAQEIGAGGIDGLIAKLSDMNAKAASAKG